MFTRTSNLPSVNPEGILHWVLSAGKDKLILGLIPNMYHDIAMVENAPNFRSLHVSLVLFVCSLFLCSVLGV